MKHIIFTCLMMMALPVAASPFSIAKSGKYEKMQCDGGACNWLEWTQDSVSKDGNDVIVQGRGKIALSELEERRNGEEKMVDEKDVKLTVRCSTSDPEVVFNGQRKSVNLDGSVNPVTGVYFRVCHNIAPASSNKFQSVIKKYYAE